MIKLNNIQTAIIVKLKATAAVTSQLASSVEIREVYWQGTKFKYPAVRVRIGPFSRHENNINCKIFDAVAHIYVLSDDASSMKINDIASSIFELFDQTSFSDSVVKLQGISAIQSDVTWMQDAGVWQSEVTLKMLASAK